MKQIQIRMIQDNGIWKLPIPGVMIGDMDYNTGIATIQVADEDAPASYTGSRKLTNRELGEIMDNLKRRYPTRDMRPIIM